MTGTGTIRPERSSATLGRTLRSILVAPNQGFGAAVTAAQRRARAGETLPEGLFPYVLTIAGGASLMILWLKIGGLLGGREVEPSEFAFTELIFALVAGAILALLGQGVWAVAAPSIARALKGSVSGRDARIVWGASAFPQVLTLLVLLPLDLLIVGPEVFATTRPGDSVATGWAAISVSLCLLMAGWSLTLFVLGMQRVANLELVRALGSVAAAAACLSLVIVAGSLILLTVWG